MSTNADRDVDADEQAFWDLVGWRGRDPDACWPWQGEVFRDGAPKAIYHGQVWGANRLAWVLAYGNIPRHTSVRQTCGDHACVNPGHLVLAAMPARHRRPWMPHLARDRR